MSETPTQLCPTITARDAQQALFSSFALDPMQYFLFGANVNYSMSPAMHNTAFRVCGMPHRYTIFQCPELRGLNELVENPYFGGSSVSLPYKTEVIPLLHSMSPHARAIGAVNTLIPIRNNDVSDPRLSEESSIHLEKTRAGPVKGLHGDNTDWIGICNCIRRGLSPANAVRPSSTGLVIGSGGMARAAIYSMIHLGVQNIFVYNRTLANAKKLADHYNRQDLVSNERSPDRHPRVSTLNSLDEPWPAAYKQPTIIVSGIPAHSIGGEPAPNFNVPTQWLESPTGGVVVDVSLQFTLERLYPFLLQISREEFLKLTHSFSWPINP
jgi:shikimate 5-dehydrogenase